jgi:glycosyltransferase involved in cell wall biosynthesis
MLPRYFYPVYSGAAMQALTLSRKLQERGIQLFVLTPRYPGLTAHDWVRGVEVFRTGTPRRLDDWKLPMALGAFLWRRRDSWDIIHIHRLYRDCGYEAVLLARWLGKRSVLKISGIRSGDPRGIRQRRLGILGFRLFLSLDRIVCISQEIRERCEGAGVPAHKLVDIPNGVDAEVFAPASAADRSELRAWLGLPDHTPVVVFVGSLNRRKGLDILMAAWQEVIGQCPGARLLLVGPRDDPVNHFGDEAFSRELDAWRSTASIGGSVVCTGSVPEVSSYLRAADVFVLPSRYEGMPNALLEAMACGLPSVATRIGGVVDVATHDQHALLVPPEDASALARALLELLGSQPLRQHLGQRARDHVQEHYSIDRIVDRYVALYRALLSTDGGVESPI